MLKLSFVLLLFLGTHIFCFSRNYVVSTRGNDRSLGTFHHPFRNIKFAISLLKPGDKCIIRGGTYYENLIFNVSGSISNPIHVCAYGNEKVIIAPSVVQGKWLRHNKHIFKIRFKPKIKQLFINQKSFFQASFPSIKEGDLETSTWGSIYAYPTKKVIMKGVSHYKNLRNCKLVGLCGRGLVALNGTVIEHSGDKIGLKNDAFYWSDKMKTGYLGKGKGFLIGSLEFLDQPGEWFQDQNFLYLWPISSKHPSKLEIQLRIAKNAITLSNQSYISITGLTLSAGSIDAKNTRGITLDRLTISYPAPFFEFRQGFERFSPNQTGSLDDFEKSNGNGVELSGSHSILRNSIIHKSWGDGLTVWGNNHLIYNNIITNCDWIGIDCAPISISGHHQLVKQNSCFRTARSVLVHRKLENSKLILNDLFLGGLLCDDLGITYCYDTDGKNTTIAYNWIHANLAPHFGPGIYLDNGHKNFNIHHNVIWDCFVGININAPLENDRIDHNTIIKNRFSMGKWVPVGAKATKVYTTNNLSDNDRVAALNKPFYGTYLKNNVLNTNTYGLLKNPKQHDFSLNTNLTSSVGAYCSKSPYWVPGSLQNNTEFTSNKNTANSSFQIKDFAIAICWAFFIGFLCFKITKKLTLNLSKKEFFILAFVKLIGALSLYAIYLLYYKNRETSDIFNSFYNAYVLYSTIYPKEPWSYIYYLFNPETTVDSIQSLLLKYNHFTSVTDLYTWRNNRFLITLNGFLLLISGGNYAVHLLFFTGFSFIGSLFIFKLIQGLIIGNRYLIIGSCFLIPSVLVWSSGINRDSLLFLFIGIACFSIFRITYFRSKLFLATILGFFSIVVLYTLKPYVLFSIVPGALSLFIVTRFKIQQNYSIFTWLLIHLIVFYCLVSIQAIGFLNQLRFIQQDYLAVSVEMHAKSKFEMSLLDGSVSQLLTKIPGALFNVFFRPFFTEIHNPLMLIAWIENLFIMLLLLYGLILRRKLTLVQKNSVAFLFSFSLILCTLIGLTVPISGAIVRYKMLCLPFLLSAILIIGKWNLKKSEKI